MKKMISLCSAAIALASAVSLAAVKVEEGYEATSIDQDFGGGFDYLPNGDIIGMYVDRLGSENAFVGIIDANGDGSPAGVDKKYDYGEPLFGSFVKVAPDGSIALFADSINYDLYSMDLANYAVTKVEPAAGSFDGAYDCAFINSTQCYISANPAFGTTNKVFHLDLSTGMLTEIISVDGTFSAPIDVDDDGNLYYVKNTGVFPLPDEGTFTLLKFDSADLAAVLGGAPAMGATDAEQLAVLDGGFDVAWHSSGAIFVSDNNHGKIYRIASISDFVTLSSDLTGGFGVLALYKREQQFGPNSHTETKLAASYASEFGDPTPSVIYQVTSASPPLGVLASGTMFNAGDNLVVTVAAGQAFQAALDAYVVLVSAGGVTYSVTPGAIVKGLAPYLEDLPGIPQGYEGTVLDMVIPQAAPAGVWTVYAGIVPAGAAAIPRNALALDSTEITIVE
jgi:hypothetical protein